MNASKHNLRPDWVDPDDAPEVTEEFFAQAEEFFEEHPLQKEKLQKCS